MVAFHATKIKNKFTTRMQGFPVATISEQVIAPALDIIRSAAAYAKCIECKNLHNDRTNQYQDKYDTQRS